MGPRARLLRKALPAAAAVATAVATGRALRPPRPAGEDARENRFAAARALPHLRALAATPRPVGSPAHQRVRADLVARLRAMGVEVTVQESVAVADLGAAPYGVRYRAAGRVHNIVARLAGTNPGPALLVMTHYDSVEQSPGASDAGMLVAAVLETVRALRAGPPLRNDVLFVLTDGEEVGLLGSRAFFAEHPAAADVRAVLNFEARGTSGPALMFETGPGSGALIRMLADTPHAAVSSSLFDEAYRRMPNTTDFAVAKDRGLRGLNFANIGGFVDYHGPTDDVDHTDLGTLQHHGDQMLELVRRLGRADLDAPDADDEVFFTVGDGRLVHYPVRAAVPLALLAAAVTSVALARQAPGGRWWSGKALLGQALRLVVGAGGATGLTSALGARSPFFRRHGDFQRSDEVYAALVGLAAAVHLSGETDPWQRLAGVLPPLSAGAVLSAARMPGASYLPTWSVLAGALAALTARGRPAVRALGSAVAASGAAALYGPLSRLLYQGLTPRMAAAPMVAMQLGADLAAPALSALPRKARRLLAAAGLTVAAGVLAHRLVRPAGADDVPETLSYVLDADAGRAVYVSTDARPTTWTAEYLGTAPDRGRLPEYFPGWQRDFLFAPAEPMDLPAPAVDVLADETYGDGRRTVTLHVYSPRGARQISLAVPDGAVHGWSVAGRSAPPQDTEDGDWELWLYAPGPDGVEVRLELDLSPVRLRVADRSDGPGVDGPRRPAAALDVDGWGNGTFVMRWLKV